MCDDFPGKTLRLIGRHCQAHALSLQTEQKRFNARIGTGFVGVVGVIVFGKQSILPVDILLGILRQNPFAQLPDPVSYKIAELLRGMLWKAQCAQAVVGCSSQIGKGVDQCAVQIKHSKTYHANSFFQRISLASRPEYSARNWAKVSVSMAERIRSVSVL